MTTSLDVLARQLSLGDFLEGVRALAGDFELVGHHTQGEFHHDVIVRVRDAARLPGRVLVVATNCNGGVKEVLAFDEVPDVLALWRHRCPGNPGFATTAALPPILARATTLHFFDPCELLRDDARSELRPEHRARQPGGGWCMK
ncbi:MAG: hypothetical protein U0234_04015 [Sandaracinus sp.]